MMLNVVPEAADEMVVMSEPTVAPVVTMSSTIRMCLPSRAWVSVTWNIPSTFFMRSAVVR